MSCFGVAEESPQRDRKQATFNADELTTQFNALKMKLKSVIVSENDKHILVPNDGSSIDVQVFAQQYMAIKIAAKDFRSPLKLVLDLKSG